MSNQEEKQKVIDTIDKKYKEAKDWLNRTVWEDYEEKDGYKAWYVDEENGLRSIKSQIVINKPMKEIYDYITNVDYKINYDNSLREAKEIVKYDENYAIHYFRYKGKLLIQDRDLYNATYIKYSEDFSEYFGTSLEDPKYEEVPSVTRATCIYAGMELKKQDNGVLLTYYTLADMKLNQLLVNTTLGEVARQVIYLKNILEK